MAVAGPSIAAQPSGTRDSIDAIARDFVTLGLQHFKHDPSTHLYIGPPELAAAARAVDVDLGEVREAMKDLRKRLAKLREEGGVEAIRRRRDLDQRLVAYIAREDILLGNLPTDFEEETRRLFGITAPHYDEAHFTALTRELDDLIPGDGDLATRVAVFRDGFVIPPDRLALVIGRAMQECRRRTMLHLALPEDEAVELHIDRDKPYVGFTYYRGDGRSDIHLNADVPVHIERAIELGCHEGYPGHHVHGSLLERELIRQRGWIEYSLVSLFGSLSVIAEGLASHAEELAFTPSERLAFERDVLLPLAGLDGADLELYAKYTRLIAELNFARNEAARKFLYGGMAREEAIEWLMRFGLETRGTAAQRLDFIEAWRSYVVTYNVGRTLVREYIAQRAGDDRDAQWRAYREIMLTPLSPDDLIRGARTGGSMSPATLAGGWFVQDPTDEGARAALEWLLPRMSTGAALHRVVEVRSQVVSGLNYAIAFELDNGELWHALMYRDLQGRFQLLRPVQPGPLPTATPARPGEFRRD